MANYTHKIETAYIKVSIDEIEKIRGLLNPNFYFEEHDDGDISIDLDPINIDSEIICLLKTTTIDIDNFDIVRFYR